MSTPAGLSRAPEHAERAADEPDFRGATHEWNGKDAQGRAQGPPIFFLSGAFQEARLRDVQEGLRAARSRVARVSGRRLDQAWWCRSAGKCKSP